MAITAVQVATTDTLETLRQQYNNLRTDVNGIDTGILNLSTWIFEGATDDAYETTITVVDPTADRTITFPNSTGTVVLTGTNLTVPNAGTIGSASDTDAISISSGGVVNFTQRPTFAASLTVQNDGQIGSTGDTDAIAISSAGVVALSATTEASATGTAALTLAGGLGVAKDVWVGDDLTLDSDATVVSFGDDQEVTLTHVHNTGLLLNSTMAIQFNDSSQYINAPSNAILDINATDEIELNATLADVNANLDVSGTYTGGGLMTTGGNIVIPDAGNIGAASATSAMAISSGGVVNFTQAPTVSSAAIVTAGTHTEYYDATSFRPTESNGSDTLSALETTAARPDILYLAFDGSADEFCQLAVVPPKKWNGGTITYRVHHTHPTGITTGVAWQLQGVAIDNDETIDVAYGSAIVITDTYLNAAEDMHITATSGAVTIGGSPDGGGDEFVVIRLGRDISDGADNTSSDAYLMGLEIDWTTNAADDS